MATVVEMAPRIASSCYYESQWVPCRSTYIVRHVCLHNHHQGLIAKYCSRHRININLMWRNDIYPSSVLTSLLSCSLELWGRFICFGTRAISLMSAVLTLIWCQFDVSNVDLDLISVWVVLLSGSRQTNQSTRLNICDLVTALGSLIDMETSPVESQHRNKHRLTLQAVFVVIEKSNWKWILCKTSYTQANLPLPVEGEVIS